MREAWALSHHERSAGRRAQRLGVELLQFYARRHQPLQHWSDAVLLPTLVRREISDVIIAQAVGLAVSSSQKRQQCCGSRGSASAYRGPSVSQCRRQRDERPAGHWQHALIEEKQNDVGPDR